MSAMLATATRADITLTDITGRNVTLPQPAQRIVLGDGRHIMVLGLLTDDPAKLVVGWRQAKALDPARLQALSAKFPELDNVASVGAGNRQLSIEKTIALQPDLVILSLIDAQDPQMKVPLAQLNDAGIPVLFLDFFSHPIENSAPSLKILGQAIGASDRAATFNAFYTQHLQVIRDRIAKADPARPSVFVQVHAAPDSCCATVGQGVFHDFITEAGGHNLGDDLVPGVMGTVGLETLIAADPDWFVATGGLHMAARGGLVIGAGVDQRTVDQSFAAVLSAPGISDLRAVQDHQALAIWHLFNDSPMHIVLIEYLAKAFHPDLFSDLDPAATMTEFQTRFSPIQFDGVFWSRPQ
ncbi:ABC transporter substrate-binding protein [Thioclava sp. SK-1]|uniref:ABC transporter substrate-binding protein n=1 Tax=Thioclava sp. SK-1 TaxID=1889770 RepID=UPI00114D0958|nr:ABC transporter substrate-binding protein [Thioclava sp. SK-1]